MDTLSEWATAYTDAGYPVFPCWGITDGRCDCGDPGCKSPGKHPLPAAAPNGLKDATDDSERVAAWWREHPNANIALAMGGAVLAVDCDRKQDVDGVRQWLQLCAQHGWDIPTVVSDTGSGGAHYLYGLSEEVVVRNQQRLAVGKDRIPGVDVRGSGGYIVVAPSKHASGGFYRWKDGMGVLDRNPAACPPGLLSVLVQHQGREATPNAPVANLASIRRRAVTEARMAEIRSALAAVPADCSYDDWTRRVGMPLHDEFGGHLDGLTLWDEWSQTAPAQYPGERQMRKLWDSFRDVQHGRTIRSLWDWAHKCGWQPPTTITPSAEASDEELEAFRAGQPRDPGPFPLEVLKDLRGPAGVMHEWIMAASRRPDPVIAFGAVLAAFSSMIGRRICAPGDTYSGIFLAVLAPSGAGKDKPQECLSRTIQSFPQARVGYMDDSPTHRTQVDEMLLDHEGQLLMVLDEYGSVLRAWLRGGQSAVHATMSPVMRKLSESGGKHFGLARLSAKHPSRAADPMRWDAGIERPCVTMLGSSTPKAFYDAVAAEATVDGFLGRHLVLESCTNHAIRDPSVSSSDIPAAVREWAEALISRVPIPATQRTVAQIDMGAIAALMGVTLPGGGDGSGAQDHGGPRRPEEPVQIERGDGCAEALEAVSDAIEAARASAIDHEDETRTALLSRLPGLISRLALILAVAESYDPTEARVLARHVHLASKVCRWSVDRVCWQLRHGDATSDMGRALAMVYDMIDRARGKKVWRSKLASRVSIAPHLARIWPLLAMHPRLRVTETHVVEIKCGEE